MSIFGFGARRIRMLLAVMAAGIITFEIVLVLAAGALGIPGLFLIDLRGGEGQLAGNGGETVIAKQAETEAAAPRGRLAVPDRATPVPREPQADLASRSDAPPPAPSPEPEMQPQQPQDKAEAPKQEEVPASGPIGWEGPPAAPGQPEPGDPNEPAPKLEGPIDLDVKDALAELNRSEAEKAEEEKKAKEAANAEALAAAKKAAPAGQLAGSGRREVLPWDQIEPDEELMALPKAGGPSAENRTVAQNRALAALPATETVKNWIQATASESGVGVDDRGRPLYRYELWLEPPADVKQRIAAVAYVFDAPSAQPPKTESRERESGFRVRFGSIACADRITLTLRFTDGQSQTVIVDGCSILS